MCSARALSLLFFKKRDLYHAAGRSFFFFFLDLACIGPFCGRILWYLPSRCVPIPSEEPCQPPFLIYAELAYQEPYRPQVLCYPHSTCHSTFLSGPNRPELILVLLGRGFLTVGPELSSVFEKRAVPRL